MRNKLFSYFTIATKLRLEKFLICHYVCALPGTQMGQNYYFFSDDDVDDDDGDGDNNINHDNSKDNHKKKSQI